MALRIVQLPEPLLRYDPHALCFAVPEDEGIPGAIDKPENWFKVLYD